VRISGTPDQGVRNRPRSLAGGVRERSRTSRFSGEAWMKMAPDGSFQ
jgi:hypothetical protein